MSVTELVGDIDAPATACELARFDELERQFASAMRLEMPTRQRTMERRMLADCDFNHPVRINPRHGQAVEDHLRLAAFGAFWEMTEYHGRRGRP